METCRACGASFHFIEGPNGKAIPAQRVKTIYVTREGVAGKTFLEKVAQPVQGPYYINHFETCSHPNRFSSGRRGQPGAPR